MALGRVDPLALTPRPRSCWLVRPRWLRSGDRSTHTLMRALTASLAQRGITRALVTLRHDVLPSWVSFDLPATGGGSTLPVSKIPASAGSTWVASSREYTVSPVYRRAVRVRVSVTSRAVYCAPRRVLCVLTRPAQRQPPTPASCHGRKPLRRNELRVSEHSRHRPKTDAFCTIRGVLQCE